MIYRRDAETQRELDSSMKQLSGAVVDAAFRVHSELGPGLLESVYEVCLAHELSAKGIKVERQVPLPVKYRNIQIEAGFRMDLVVEGKLVVEVKSVDELASVHKAQVITYLKLSKMPLGLLINFNVPLIKDGIKRVILSSPGGATASLQD